MEKAEKERDELKLTLEKFQNSSKSLNNLLESEVIDKFKTVLRYNAASSTAASPAVESFVNSSEMLENQENNKSKSDKGYHAVPPPYTGNFIPFKPDLTFMDEIVENENMDVTTIVKPSNEPKTVRKNSFRPPVIEDWNFDDVKMRSNPQQKITKEKGVLIDSGCLRHMTENKCYLTEYEDFNGGFVSFGDEENAEFQLIWTVLSTYVRSIMLTLLLFISRIISGELILLFNEEDGIAFPTNDENNGLVDSPPRHIETHAGGALAQTSLKRGYTLEVIEVRLKPGKKCKAICIKLSKHVLNLEKEKDAQAVEILKLKQRVKKLERKRKSSISHLRRRIYRQVESFNNEEDASKQRRKSDKTKSMFQDSEFDVLDDDMEDVEGETLVEPRTPPTTAATAFIDEDLTIAQTLIKIKEEKGKEKGKGLLVDEDLRNHDIKKKCDQGLAPIESDRELLQRYMRKKRARLLAEFFERRKKQLAAERAEAIRNKPPTRTQKLYEREKKWIDDFKPINDDSEQQAESTKKRPRADSKEESSKKQKLEKDNDAEKEELIDSMVVVPRDDVAIDVESLATKYLIVDWKTHILKNGSSKNYKIFSEMLDDFDRQDVIDPHRLVNEIYETTSPEGYDLLLWDQQDYNLISWRLFDSCGVHVLLMNTIVAIHMMIEKIYPLTQEMLSRMLNRRLEVDYESEMAF
ncbi:hypothetical protein Tco_1447386 [Tanacetum coccineum]